MDEKSIDIDKNNIDEVMLPGFRFHPTDEELVAFYLKRKIQQRPLPIELIKQVDIYKFDPWDLPKLATTGEKECYFYCPRDRKYRNSARPNRVTGAGFWKATGTDRPIYSSDGTRCIGLKKSLVFYRGRAAKGIKTDWMMHEFRLPSLSDSSQPKKVLDKNIPANDAWAICRIFKKTNSMAQRALSHSWVSPFPEEPTACTTEMASGIQLCGNNHQQASIASFSALDIPSYKQPLNSVFFKPSLFPEIPSNLMFSQPETEINKSFTLDGSSSMLLLNTASESIEFDRSQQQARGYSVSLPQENPAQDDNNQWGIVRSMGFPFSLPLNNMPEAWKPNLAWDSPPPLCPTEMSTTYSPNNY